MGPRTRRPGAALGAAVLLSLVIAAPNDGFARSQTASAVTPVVSPFFLQPEFTVHDPSTLRGLVVGGATPSERAITACSICGKTKFAKKVDLHRVLVRVLPPLRMRSGTRVLVGVTAPGEDGRWIVMGFQGGQYKGLGHGCMPPTVTSFTPAEAAHPSTIPTAGCGFPPPDNDYVYWRGTDGQLYEKQYVPPKWSPPIPIGSGHGVASAPTAVALPNHDRDVFWQGTDGWLHEMTYTGFWSNPRRLPGREKLTSPPSAVVNAHGVVLVFFRGTDRFLWAMGDYGGVWSLPAPFNSGPVESAPAAVVLPGGALELYWWAGKLYEDKWPTQQTPTLLSAAGPLGSAPTAIVDTHGIVHVFWRGTNAWLWELSNPDSGSGSVQRNSGPLASAPSAVVHPDNVQDLFWRSTKGGLREMQWYSGKWNLSYAVPFAGDLGSAPAAVLGQ
jgi:hypothetical protein